MKTLLNQTASVRKRQALGTVPALALFFVLSAFTFMNFLYCLSDCIGSIVCGSMDVAARDALRSIPIFLSFFLSLSGLMTACAFRWSKDPGTLRRSVQKHALITVVLGAFVPLYVIGMRLAGRYLSLTEGAPSRLYPLDALLYALLFLAFGVGVLRYVKRALPPAAALQSPRRKRRVVARVFRAIWLLLGLYGFCGFFFGLFILDFTVGYVPYSLAMLLVSLLAFASLVVWELFYRSLSEDSQKTITLPLSLVSLAVSLAADIAYFLALKHNLEGPSNVGFGILPVAVSASVNLATLLVVATPLIVSLTALVRGLRYRR